MSVSHGVPNHGYLILKGRGPRSKKTPGSWWIPHHDGLLVLFPINNSPLPQCLHCRWSICSITVDLNITSTKLLFSVFNEPFHFERNVSRSIKSHFASVFRTHSNILWVSTVSLQNYFRVVKRFSPQLYGLGTVRSCLTHTKLNTGNRLHFPSIRLMTS